MAPANPIAVNSDAQIQPAAARRRDPRFVLTGGYARLPAAFYARLDPATVAAPRLIRYNCGLAADLGLPVDGVDDADLAAVFSGNVLPEGADPIAMAYAGHQFGGFVPQLGDGRAILLGEVTDRAGCRRDIQLKGSGRTPFSRNGDGLAALGPVLREYLLSEFMHAIGIPATRALAAVSTGETVYRERALPGAILTRVAASHVRVGTFQYFAARGDLDSVRRLADHVIDRHFPALPADPDDPRTEGGEFPAGRHLALLREVLERQARLIAKWMCVGFIHGVMNTDNMAVSGETIDFGPCAFMDAYDPAKVFSSIDSMGRYAYSNQPRAAQWNLARFAETLLPLIDPLEARAIELATAELARFPARFEAHWLSGMRRKLGLDTAEDGDADLVRGLLEAMHAGDADFTLTFRRLCDAAANANANADEGAARGSGGAGADGVRALFADAAAFDSWAAAWASRLSREPGAPAERAAAMRLENPAYIARNHRVEQAIEAAVERADFTVFGDLLAVLEHPFEESVGRQAYAQPPLPAERVLQTFCGT
jgi:uncharacterized protein YdiU (UPF0061 family)